MSISGRSLDGHLAPSSPGHRPSRAGTPSLLSSPRQPPNRKVTTVPPWARDEPPSPLETPYVSPIIDSILRPVDTIPPLSLSPEPTLSSTTSANAPLAPETSWWTFVTHPLPRSRQPNAADQQQQQQRQRQPGRPDSPTFPLDRTAELAISISADTGPAAAGGAKSRSPLNISSFFPRAGVQRHLTMPSIPLPAPSSTPASPSAVLRSLQFPRGSAPPSGALSGPGRALPANPTTPDAHTHNNRPASIHLDLSHPAEQQLPSNTLRQVMTPGWESPWQPTRPAGQGAAAAAAGAGAGTGAGASADYGWGLDTQGLGDSASTSARGRNKERAGNAVTDRSGTEGASVESRWRKGKKRWRNFCLYHSGTPLLFRLLNIAFTTSALAVAIHTQLLEQDADVDGVLGSSPSVTIVFAPLTLIHVMIAIYLEYFGRPLGLWRTSAKLAHTLVEVIFVCLWSSALSLAIDNFLTTPLRCAPRHAESWWSDQPPTPNPLSDDTDMRRAVCRDQLALITLVLVGLCSYCANLVISLFRIFERVKVRTVDYRWSGLGAGHA